MKLLALLSGGLDSTVALAQVLSEHHEVAKAISFYYGQTHSKEVNAAIAVAKHYRIPHSVISLNFNHIGPTEVGQLLNFKLDAKSPSRTVKDQHGEDVSATFVPGRNIIFLAYAGSICDSEALQGICIGVNAVDYSGYPDCRPRFIGTMESALSAGLRQSLRIHAPVLYDTKIGIVKKGLALGAPLALTWSCYAGGETPCTLCPSCKIRIAAFAATDIEDPALAPGGSEC